MANHKSALKRIRTTAKKRVRNRIYTSRTRSSVRTAREAIQGGDEKLTIEAVRTAISTLDKAATKGIIHRNAAARSKSRLMKKFNALQAK